MTVNQWETTCIECNSKKLGRFCDKCNSDTRSASTITVTDTNKTVESISLIKKSKGFKGFSWKFFEGWTKSFKYKDGVDLSRTLDKEKDEYHEVVKDPITGKILHENHEKLTEHIGHGSAKNKQ